MLKLVIIVFIPDRDQNRDRKVLTEDQEDQLIPKLGDTADYSQPYGPPSQYSLTAGLLPSHLKC